MRLKRLTLAALVAAFFMPAVCNAGGASFYTVASNHGTKTASGIPFNDGKNTCAHKSLPFGTRLRVTYKGNSTVCTVTDRGPYVAGRVVDLSLVGAREIGLVGAGHGEVTISKE